MAVSPAPVTSNTARRVAGTTVSGPSAGTISMPCSLSVITMEVRPAAAISGRAAAATADRSVGIEGSA